MGTRSGVDCSDAMFGREVTVSAASRPTAREAVDSFAAAHLAGTKTAPAIRYRLERPSRSSAIVSGAASLTSGTAGDDAEDAVWLK